MSRVRRKGFFSKPAAAAPDGAPAIPEHTFASEHRVSVTSNRGYGVAESYDLDLAEFADVPLIAENLQHLSRELLAGRTPQSLKAAKQLVRALARYANWYADRYHKRPCSSADIDVHFCHQVIIWLSELEVAESGKSQRIRFFKRFMTAIGVDDSYLPTNPFFSTDLDTQPRDELSQDDARHLLAVAKSEARVVLRRTEEVKVLSAAGRDPRRKWGGQNGDWSEAANRVWVMINVFQLRIRNFDEMRFKGGLRSELAGIEGRPGAEVVGKDGKSMRQVGWKGHLRWFFPWSDDLAPFVVLLLLRTGWNLATAAALRAGNWQVPYPFRVGEASNETHVYIISYKTRGRRAATETSKAVKVPSSRKPWSHPYRLLLSVEEITKSLRAEVLNQISELRRKKGRSVAEDRELKRLEAIKDDLFIYKTEQSITSLAWDTRGGKTPRWLDAFMLRAGTATGLRLLRDAHILFSYEMSGQNLFVAQLTAAHANSATTALYLRRRTTLNRVFERAMRVFELSLAFIEKDKFDVAALRQAMAEQGFDEHQIANLENPANTARWGNRCAEPRNPPREFSRGTPRDGVCVLQDCIDGCPHARWFHDSIDHVARNLVLAENLTAALGVESTEGSSVNSRIDRCQELLKRWPSAEADAALVAARSQLSGSCDLFLGTAT